MSRNADQSPKSADELIALLDLAPHPEGGYFRETYRDPHVTDANSRSTSTAIYFLLRAGEVSHWHRIDAAEVWHWYAGATLELSFASPALGGHAERIRLGNDFAAGDRPQVVVPQGYWQRARSLGDFTLVGCTVAPGFLFETFKLAPPGFEPGQGDS